MPRFQNDWQIGTTLENCPFVICKIFAFKYPKTTSTVLYILFTCLNTLSQMFPTVFKSREIRTFNQCKVPCHCVACQWRHVRVIPGFRFYCRRKHGKTVSLMNKCGSSCCSVYSSSTPLCCCFEQSSWTTIIDYHLQQVLSPKKTPRNVNVRVNQMTQEEFGTREEIKQGPVSAWHVLDGESFPINVDWTETLIFHVFY